MEFSFSFSIESAEKYMYFDSPTIPNFELESGEKKYSNELKWL